MNHEFDTKVLRQLSVVYREKGVKETPRYETNCLASCRRALSEPMMSGVFFDRQSCLSFYRTVPKWRSSISLIMPKERFFTVKMLLAVLFIFMWNKKDGGLAANGKARRTSATVIHNNDFVPNKLILKTRRML